jgi:hypothetical protein
VKLEKQRITYRVSKGGHGIPDEDVEKQYLETFKNLKMVLPMCNLASLYDNTKEFRRIAIYKDGIPVRIFIVYQIGFNEYNRICPCGVGLQGLFCCKKKEGKSDDMKVEDLLEQMICERIEMLLDGRSDEAIQEEKEFKDRTEEFIGQMDKEWKVDIERLWDEWITQSAEDNRYLYFAGVKDGVRIFKMISGDKCE